MVVISDTSPLIHLTACEQVELLHTLYGEIVIPSSVEEELRFKSKDEKIKQQIFSFDWIKVKTATDKKLVADLDKRLGGAEAEAIALAVELKADLLLIDERKGRLAARELHLKTGGVLSVLIEAKKKNLIESVTTLIEKMVAITGFRISNELFEEVKKIAEE